MSDANAEEPHEPSAFNLPDGHRSESHAYPDRTLHVLLATTGSVASVKAPLIAEALLEYANVELQVVASDASTNFYDANQVSKGAKATGKKVTVWRDSDEWTTWKQVGDPILHIELRRWADVILIAPLSANSLAKLSNGICDNLLSSLMRALDPKRTKVYIFPAMNTFMWEHPFTALQLDTLKSIGYEVVGPIGKKLACGDIGMGAMTEWQDIVKLVVDEYTLQMAGPSKRLQADPSVEQGQKSLLSQATAATAESNLADVSRFGLA